MEEQTPLPPQPPDGRQDPAGARKDKHVEPPKARPQLPEAQQEDQHQDAAQAHRPTVGTDGPQIRCMLFCIVHLSSSFQMAAKWS